MEQLPTLRIRTRYDHVKSKVVLGLASIEEQ